jgi:hypothetical protein
MNESDLPLQEHVRMRQIELAQSLEPKKAIYLDIKFWIIMRDVVVGRRTHHADRELLSLLRKGLAEGTLFCPISDSTFAELLKQSDVKSREVTAHLIDELSLGVTLIPFDMRAGTELAHLLHSVRTPKEVHPLKLLVWSKLSYVMGFLHPHGTPFDRSAEMLMQKSFFEYMWSISLREMIHQIGDKALPNPELFGALAQRLNKLNAEHASELRSFKNTYDFEVHGILDVFEDVTVNIVAEMIRADFGDRPPLSPDARKEEGRQLHNLLFAAFERDATKDALRTLHILASLHAAVRWNKQQQLKGNDFLDFQHATAALGYCDAFFTERSLRAMITASHVALDRRYGCHVVASSEEAGLYLRSLLGP